MSSSTFQHFVIQMVWKNTTLLHLSLALYSERDRTFGQSQVFSESACSYWHLYAVLLSNRWRRYELIGRWNKWCALWSKTGLWQLDELSYRWHHQPAWAELRQTSLHRCNFPCNHFICEFFVQTGLTVLMKWKMPFPSFYHVSMC